ncbi:MAG: thioredoxin family protein [Chthoniobacter sp.]|uniref:thioredoxin family protein n=1 Tax=Chthoniobacter sp. TaxID=2510640 RepID=UPI0032A4445D
MNPILLCCFAACLAVAAVSCSREAAAQEGPHVETGKVAWGRDLKSALSASRRSGKPVFALFQEVPGCMGCKQFGRNVLSHPLVVQGIETEFTPLLIHNNSPGPDAEVLQHYGEPAWSYQVVRFLDAEGRDIIPRKDHVWDAAPLAERMIATLEKAGRPVPEYLKTVASGSPAPPK